MSFELKEFGDSGVLLTFGDEINVSVHLEILGFVKGLKQKNIPGVLGIVSAYCTVTIQYDFLIVSFEELIEFLYNLKYKPEVHNQKNIVEIPVCYDDSLGLDMNYLCSYTGLTKKEVVQLHTKTDYLVYMLGFTPGFFYLGGLDAKLFCPRKETPRLKIESGSVGIAGNQTGVYSVDSPGGWQLIGKTPLKIFDKHNKSDFFRVKQGDFVRFVEMSIEEYKAYLS